MQEFILSVSSLDRSYYDNSSSCDFRINLQNTMYKIQSCHAISGVVPCISSNIYNPFLYLTLDELRSFNVRVSNGLNSVSDIIHIDHDTSGLMKISNN